MSALPLPTRRDEAWRYSDLEALARIWPVAAPEPLTVAEGQAHSIELLQDAPDDAVVIEDHTILLMPGSRLDVKLLNIGGKLGRVSFDVILHRGAHFELAAAQIGGGEQTLEIVTTVRHLEPDARSNQTIRSVLAGHATGNALGRIEVARGAVGTDAAQSVKAILLDRTATANARPELEIFADDVKCAHGATVGELDRTALFYLASRGLAPDAARTLLIEAFIAGLFDGAEREEDYRAAGLAKLRGLG